MNKYFKTIVCACVLSGFCLTGCSQFKTLDRVDTTSVVITDKGSVTHYLVDYFDKDYYNISDLSSMAVEEAAAYNTSHQSGEVVPVTVEKVEFLEDGSDRVMIMQNYDSTGTFVDYNESVLFYGTVAEAAREGYDLDVTLKNVIDDTLLSKEQLLQNTDRYVVITEERALIYCPKSVTHISDGSVLRQDGSVDTTASENVVVILMK